MSDAPLHALIGGLEGSEAAYERGRPGYPAPLLSVLLDGTGAGPGSRVLDLGAGTGLLARPLLDAGCDVVAVEPLAGMRAALARAIGAERVLDGTAEAIPLPAEGLDAVLCGDSFHWFGPGAADELHRVLRPGGGLGIAWRWAEATPDAPWVTDLHLLLDGVRPPHPAFETADRGRGRLDAHGGFSAQERREVHYRHPTSRSGVRDYVASITFIGALEPGLRAALLGEVDALTADLPPRFDLPVVAECWFTRRRP